ncbi:hypothetical protein B5X24_HaOG206585 [Helicoverpa armigera]|uniref:Uncharacterized protein n=1 Tax=Helicoverpa armigera TaxID=29058 RepID=A0A2W1BQZ0_HELAM|nr:hypothetical protein B5X24_HaOG206585 [Helicoverpa armigera]
MTYQKSGRLPKVGLVASVYIKQVCGQCECRTDRVVSPPCSGFPRNQVIVNLPDRYATDSWANADHTPANNNLKKTSIMNQEILNPLQCLA